VRVLMLGWEFPPYFAGGVGVVCHALTKALAARGVEVTYVMPSGPAGISSEHVRLLVASQIAPTVKIARISAALEPYVMPEELPAPVRGALRPNPGHAAPLYGRNLLEEVEKFSARLETVVQDLGLEFDVIHAHDWTTFPAGLAVRRLTGKPLIIHVHITEFDKSGGLHANPLVWEVEKTGMEGADLVVTVSNRVREQCIERYGVNADRIQVVYNGVDPQPPGEEESPWHSGDGKVVLFLGRVTLQKGPEYFVEAARRVLEVDPDVTFIMAGSGDMLPRMIERSADLGIGSRMVFTGFVDREEATRLYRLADVFVMPSVSEPFGIVPLEAMSEGVPVIVSRQSGVSEVVRHAIKVDFWDVEDLAGKILAALAYPTLASELREQGRVEAERLGWDRVAAQMSGIYGDLCRR
jgi:glycosyltransferase involved in cell wall biosynthesis